MRLVLVALAILAVTTPAEARWRTVGNAEAILLWSRANELCRGGNHLPNDLVCRQRDALGVALEKRGWCFEYRDWRVMPSDYRWHRC